MPDQSLDFLKPEDIICPEHFGEFSLCMSVFSDDLTFLHTNLNLLKQIMSFDADLFEAPKAFILFFSSNLVTESIVIICRLWYDLEYRAFPLNKFSNWVLNKAVRSSFKKEFQARLSRNKPSKEILKLIKEMREIRRAQLAHLDYKVLSSVKIAPKLIDFENLSAVADVLGRYYHALEFGTETHFVIINLQAQQGDPYSGDFGYVLEQIALGSKWFNKYLEKFPDLLGVSSLSSEDLEKINEIRMRHNMTIFTKNHK